MKISKKQLKNLIKEMSDNTGYSNIGSDISYAGRGRRPVSTQPTLSEKEEQWVLEWLRNLIRAIEGTGASQRKVSKRAVVASLDALYQQLFTGPPDHL